MAALTAAQRYHSSLFSKYHSEGNRILDSHMSTEIHEHPDLDAPRQTLRDFIRAESCGNLNSSTVIGTVVSADSHPIDDGSFFFTDYTVRLTHVFRSPIGRPLQAGESIVVGLPGGKMTIDGFDILATSNRYPLLTVGQEYLLFAQHDKALRVFHSLEPVFIVTARTIAALAPEFLSFLSEATNSKAIPRPEVDQLLQTVGVTCR